MNEQVDSNGMPEAPVGGGDPTEDVQLSNTGQRIGVILVVILILAGGGFWFWKHSQKVDQIAALDKLKADFGREHNASYEEFWKAAQIDLKVMKTNADFGAKLAEYLTVSPVSYAKHVKEKALPHLENGIPRYRALEAAGIMLPELKATTHAFENLLNVWQKFANEILLYENYLAHQSKLDALGGQWMAAQQNPKDEKPRPDAARYVKIVNCILDGKFVMDYDPWDLSERIRDTCAKGDEKAEWFRRVAFNCLDASTQNIPADELFLATVEQYGKIEQENQDNKSVFGIKECLDKSRTAFEAELSDAVAAAWAEYVAKKNALLNGIDARRKEI